MQTLDARSNDHCYDFDGNTAEICLNFKTFVGASFCIKLSQLQSLDLSSVQSESMLEPANDKSCYINNEKSSK